MKINLTYGSPLISGMSCSACSTWAALQDKKRIMHKSALYN